jgi:hypothetical protein
MRKKTDGVVILPILIGLAVAAIVWVASYRGGTSKRADANIPNPPVAAIAVAASALNGTASETQMTDKVGRQNAFGTVRTAVPMVAPVREVFP